MVIVSINIASFGKLSNFSLNLNRSTNVILQDNSFGKSTLASFIRTMLYGVDYRKQSMYYYKNFQPWHSDGKFGGSMVIEHNGRQYRIERYFGSTQRSETVSLYDLASGNKIQCDNVGEYLLGLSSQSYEQSIFIPQEAVTLSNNQNFEQKLSGMIEGDKQENDYNKATERLKQYCKSLKAERGRGGLIPELEDKLNNLYIDRQNATNAQSQLQQLEENVKSYKQRISQLDAQERQLNEQSASLRAQNIALANRQGGNHTEQLNEAKQFVSRYNLPQIVADKSTVEQMYYNGRQSQGQSAFFTKLTFGILLIVLALLVVVAGFVLKQTTFGLIGGGCFLFAGIVLIIMGKKKNAPQINDTKAQQSVVLDRLAKTYGINEVVTVESMLKILTELESQYNKYQTVIALLGNQQGDNLSQISQNYDKVQSQLNELNNSINTLRSERDNILQQIGDSERQLSVLLQKTDVNVINDGIADTESQLRDANERYNNAQLAMKLLEQARLELSCAYIPRLARLSSDLLSKATNGNFGGVTVDKDFNISLTEKGKTFPIDAFSRGIRELAVFCFRVTLADTVFNGKVPFLIVDDTFVNLDEKNFNSAVRLLQVLSQHGTQIIYMTCHNRCKALFGLQ